METQGKGKDGVGLRVVLKKSGTEFVLLYAYLDSFKITYINEEKSEVVGISAESSYPGCNSSSHLSQEHLLFGAERRR